MNQFIHKGEDKKQFVRKMFDEISGTYDFLNKLLSLGIDARWRMKFISQINIKNNAKILDLATGTGDIAIKISRKYFVQVIGLDYSPKMIDQANLKKKNLKIKNIDFIVGDAEKLPFKDEEFDVLTISFGLRNLGFYSKAFEEFFRVLKPGGSLHILEFFPSDKTIFSIIFSFYFKNILPAIGSFFSGTKAYHYLPESVDNFLSKHKLQTLLSEANFKGIENKDMTFGICTSFKATK